MDAEKLGPFIAARRKELGLTQRQLAEKLHVTDKAVSRWERGVGLPDIGSIEPLADALEISLAELMRAERITEEKVSVEETDRLLSDALQLKKHRISGVIGTVILAGFAAVILLMAAVLVTDGSIVLFSVGSITLGLISWGIPIGQIFFSRRKTLFPSLCSFGFALAALTLQFFDLRQEVLSGDLAAVEDTIGALAAVAMLFSLAVLLLNLAAMKKR